jgi:hypothetical protein
MMARLADFYPSTVTIQQATENVDAVTGEITVSWANFAGHVGLPCAHGPTGGQEIKRADETYVVSNYTISLPSHHTDITEKMRAVLDGVNWEILLVQASSHGMVTRLLTRVVT